MTLINKQTPLRTETGRKNQPTCCLFLALTNNSNYISEYC
jgi:hypothetical protein